jgi:hypothetical protein
MEAFTIKSKLRGYAVWQAEQLTAAKAGSSGSSLWPGTQQFRQTLTSAHQFALNRNFQSFDGTMTAWVPDWAEG